MKQRRSVWHWIAALLGVQERIDNEHDKRVYDAGYNHGCLDTHHAQQARMPTLWGNGPPVIVYMPSDMQRPLSASYELPERTTGPTHPAVTSQLQKLIDTTTMPVVGPGQHGMMDAYNARKRRSAP